MFEEVLHHLSITITYWAQSCMQDLSTSRNPTWEIHRKGGIIHLRTSKQSSSTYLKERGSLSSKAITSKNWTCRQWALIKSTRSQRWWIALMLKELWYMCRQIQRQMTLINEDSFQSLKKNLRISALLLTLPEARTFLQLLQRIVQKTVSFTG